MKYIKLFEQKYENFDLMTFDSRTIIELLKEEIEKEDYDIEYIREIIYYGHFDIDVLYDRRSDWSFLMKASYLGKEDIVKALLDSGANPNLQNKLGFTALMYAANRGQSQAIQAILSHPKTDPNLQNEWGWTALMIAASLGQSQAVQAILSHPAIDITLTNDGGRTAWDLAKPEIREQFPELKI